MKLNNCKLLVIGKSASGKDVIVGELRKRGLSVLLSYTTRPKRADDDKEPKHIYVEEMTVPIEDTIAYAELYGYKYWATKKQFEESDIYIIDPVWAQVLAADYKECKVIIVAICADDEVIKERLISRGDNKELLEKKYNEDKELHKDDESIADIVIYNNGTLDSAVESLLRVLKIKGLIEE